MAGVYESANSENSGEEKRLQLNKDLSEGQRE